jgi:hypothetical protein
MMKRLVHTRGDGEELLAAGDDLFVIFFGNPAGGTNAHAILDMSQDLGQTWSSRADPCGRFRGDEADTADGAASRGLLALLCVPRFGGHTYIESSVDAGDTFKRSSLLPFRHLAHIRIGRRERIIVSDRGHRAISRNHGLTWRS